MPSCQKDPDPIELKEQNNGTNRSNLVIGLTGPFGSGCSSTADVLKKDYNFELFKISDDIKSELKKAGKYIKKGKKGWRKIMQQHGNHQREKDRAYWVNKIIEKIDNKMIGTQSIVVDGFRNFLEVQAIRNIFPQFFLVAICAEKDKRWKRVQKDYKGNYNEFEEDDRRDQNEDFDWGQSVQRCVDDADYVYYNNDDVIINLPGNGEKPNSAKISQILQKQVNDFVPLMQGRKEVRPPYPMEIQIAAAYAQARSSTCLKRQVGSVITTKRDGQEFPISMGFNENPPGMPTCRGEKGCFKDVDMKAKLTERGKGIYCPSCGKHHTRLNEPWVCDKCDGDIKAWLHPNRNMELRTAIHAEERAILSLGNRSADKCTLYVTTFPCFQCARLILDAGIEKIVYVEAYPTKETTKFLEANRVDVIPFSGFTARAFFKVFRKVQELS